MPCAGSPALPSWRRHEVSIFNDTVRQEEVLAERLADAEAVVLIRERTRITGSLLERLPRLRLISQTAKAGAHIDLDACTRHGVAVVRRLRLAAFDGGADLGPDPCRHAAHPA